MYFIYCYFYEFKHTTNHFQQISYLETKPVTDSDLSESEFYYTTPLITLALMHHTWDKLNKFMSNLYIYYLFVFWKDIIVWHTHSFSPGRNWTSYSTGRFLGIEMKLEK